MRATALACVALSLFLGTLRAEEIPQAKPGDVGMSAEKLEAVRTTVQGLIDKNQTAGAIILVARRGKIVRQDVLGKMDVESGKAMQPDAIFRIYSMTKPITSVAVLMLVEEGKVKLDDPVSVYLPEFKSLRVYTDKGEVDAKRPVTVRDLLRHTSGLTYGFFGDTGVDKLYRDNKVLGPDDNLADLVTKLGKLPLLCQPGTKFNYSVSTDVLGRVVEVASTKSFDEFLQERIFTPLDMKDTGFFVPEAKKDRFTTSYHPGNNGPVTVADAAATSRFGKKPKLLSGGGGLVSTARDYLRFAQMLANGGELYGKRLLKTETVKEMTSNQLPAEALPMAIGGMPLPGMGFGLGVSVNFGTKGEKTDPAAGQFGWSGAASTHFFVAPKAELIVVAMQQVEPYNVALQLALPPVVYAALE